MLRRMPPHAPLESTDGFDRTCGNNRIGEAQSVGCKRGRKRKGTARISQLWKHALKTLAYGCSSSPNRHTSLNHQGEQEPHKEVVEVVVEEVDEAELVVEVEAEAEAVREEEEDDDVVIEIVVEKEEEEKMLEVFEQEVEVVKEVVEAEVVVEEEVEGVLYLDGVANASKPDGHGERDKFVGFLPQRGLKWSSIKELEALVRDLRSGNPHRQLKAAFAIYSTSLEDNMACNTLAVIGAMSPLVALLESTDSTLVSMALKSLIGLSNKSAVVRRVLATGVCVGGVQQEEAMKEGENGSVHLPAEERAARASLEKEEALRRLRDAEVRLREAINELHGNNGQWSRSLLGTCHLCNHRDSCLANAISNLCNSFLLAYGVRVGIGVLLRAFKLARKRSYRSILDLKLLVSEGNLIVREEACRIGLLFGGFSGGFHAIRCILRRVREKESSIDGFIAGTIAGFSILALDDTSRRRTLALYLLVRLAQCAYNSVKAKNKYSVGKSLWRHGDILLFVLSCAQVMYAYVMRPETLPESYLEFIVKTGPIAKPVLKAVRESCRFGSIDIAALSHYIVGITGTLPDGLDSFTPIVPCSAIHPKNMSCLRHNGKAMQATFRKTFPLYMSLTFVPFVVLNLQKFMQAPMHTFWNALKGAIRSTSFLSLFVGLYQGIICLQRKVATKDHKSVYWISGAFAALSVLLEKKNRRSELALYVLPRAADSLWYILVNRHLLPDIKHTEVVLFCLCMGGIMYYHEHEPDTMAPYLRGLISRFLSKPDQSPLQAPPYPFFQSPTPLLGSTFSDDINTDLAKHNSGDLAIISGPNNALRDNRRDDKGQGRNDAAKNAEKLEAEAFQGL